MDERFGHNRWRAAIKDRYLADGPCSVRFCTRRIENEMGSEART
jgi:hypothetical protein